MFRTVRRAARGVARRPRFALLALVALAAVPSGAAVYVRREAAAARADIDENRPADARRRLDRCLRVWPWGADLHRLAGRAARADGDLPAAEAHLSRALQLAGGATESVQVEFLLLRAQGGELDTVAPVLLQTVEDGHEDGPLILETLARAYMVQLRYRPAYVCLKRWIELRPDVPRAYQWRAWVTERLDNHKLAAADYARAIAIDPDLVFSRLRLAELHLEDRAVADAVPHLERLYATSAANPMVRSRLGMCRFLEGNAREARQLMEGAVGELPDDPQLLLYLGRLEIQEGRYAEAEKWLRRILVSDPTDNEARYALVNVYQLQGRTADAATALKEYEGAKTRLLRVNALLKDVVDRPTATADEFAEVGEFLLVLGRTEVARYWLERALQRDPAHARAKAALERAAEQKRTRPEPQPPTGP